MNPATLKMLPDSKDRKCWDRLTLVINSNKIDSLIPFKDRNSALEAYRQLYVAYSDNHIGSLTICIDGVGYQFSEDVWQSVLSCLDQWYEEFMLCVVFKDDN